MTQELDDLLKQCAVAATSVRPGDVTALAQLHTQVQLIGELAIGQLAAVATAAQTALLIEKVVIGDTDDAEASLRDISQQIDALHALLQPNAISPPAVVVQRIATPSPVLNKEEHADIAAERAISDFDVPMALEFVGEANGHLELAEKGLLSLANNPTQLAELNSVFRAFHSIKGVAGFLELNQIGALAHATETVLDLARKEKLRLSGNVLDIVLEARDVMKTMVSAVDAAARTQTAPAQQEGLSPLLQRLTASARGEKVPAAVVAVSSPVPEAAVTTTLEATAAPSAPTEANVRVSTARLDTLINTVGELVIAQSMVAQDLGGVIADPRLARNLSQLGKITRSLQDLSMSMRMVPIGGVFQKMARLTRDMARKAGKEINFVQIGGDTELDRNVVEAISDPLVHMVRNAIDHGIESPADRVAAGKPRAGTLTLTASHQAGNVVVEISDDGRGLSKEKIVAKAVAAGIVNDGQPLSEQDIFQLIFHPGLSTADKISDISGRGVGMDVVKKNVEALRGRIEIQSTPGHGSAFTVRLPLTLAVIDGLIVKVGTHRYIIPLTSIEQSLRPSITQLSTVQGTGEMCMVRDRLLPIIRLHRLFGVEPINADPTQALIVIVQDGPHRRCLLVDELIGQQQVVIKAVGPEIGHLPGIAGCAILGDGNVSLILDVTGIVHSSINASKGNR